MKKLVIIPAYNEESAIGSVLSELKNYKDFDILVVNDGSSDRTLDIIIEHKVNYIHFQKNQGIGSAMKAGYKYAVKHNYDIAVQVDGDGQHDISRIRTITDPVCKGDYDLVIGSRYVTKTDYPITVFRRLGSMYLSLLLYLTGGVRIHDPTSGFRAANKRVIRLFSYYYPHDYPEVPTLSYLIHNNYRVCEIPVFMKKRQGGKTSISFLDAFVYMIKVSVACITCRK